MTWQMPASRSGRDPVQGDWQHLTPNSSSALADEFQAQGVCFSTQFPYVEGHPKPQQKVSSYCKLAAESRGMHHGKDQMLSMRSQTEVYTLTLQLRWQYEVQDYWKATASRLLL